MGIWGRLGNVIKSYLNDDDDKINWRSDSKEYAPREDSRYGQSDSDFEAACEELDDFLKGKTGPDKPVRQIPTEIQEDLAELGLSPQAGVEECKAAYKKLLKIHHPDRHAGNPENMKKATEKTARVNAAYERLQNWFRLQNG